MALGVITRNLKYGTWAEADAGRSIGPRMPYYVNDSNQAFLTTDADNYSPWWGALVTAKSGWDTAPWIEGGLQSPDFIWYWER